MVFAHMRRIWLVFHLVAAVADALIGQGRAVQLQGEGSDSSLDGQSVLLFVPGLEEVADAVRLRDHVLAKIKRGGIRVHCVAFNYQAGMKATYAKLLHNVCEVEDNVGGAYLDHYLAAARWKPKQKYSYFLCWGPRLWVPAQTFDLTLLMNLLLANNASAVGPAMQKGRCPVDDSTKQRSAASNQVEDRHYMHVRPHDDLKIAGRMVPFLEFQVTLFSSGSFRCLTKHINAFKIKFWGSDVIFPATCDAHVGVVDLAELTVSKCRADHDSYHGSDGDVARAEAGVKSLHPDYKRPGVDTIRGMVLPDGHAGGSPH